MRHRSFERKIEWKSPASAGDARLEVDSVRLTADQDGFVTIPAGKSVSLYYMGGLEGLGAYLAAFGPGDVRGVSLDRRVGVTGEQLRLLATFRHTLESLDLRRSRVEDHVIDSIRPLDRLKYLWLGRNEAITGAAMRNLRGLTQLKELGLGKTSIDDDSLRDFLPLPSLEYLDIDHTFVSERSLTILSACTTLRSLGLYGTDWSAEAIQSLREALPGCDIGFP